MPRPLAVRRRYCKFYGPHVGLLSYPGRLTVLRIRLWRCGLQSYSLFDVRAPRGSELSSIRTAVLLTHTPFGACAKRSGARHTLQSAIAG